MIHAAVAGLLTGLSIIVAIGAQNAFVLRQGLLRSHVGPVVAVCTLSDVILISAGVAGIGVLVTRADWVMGVARWLGVVFLISYALACLRRAAQPQSLVPGSTAPARRWPVIGRTLALTWLNPHVYLDIALYGTIANSHGADGRWWFAVGLAVASAIWFSGLGFGARLLAPVLGRPRSWQVLDVAIAATMLAIALRLALD